MIVPAYRCVTKATAKLVKLLGDSMILLQIDKLKEQYFADFGKYPTSVNMCKDRYLKLVHEIDTPYSYGLFEEFRQDEKILGLDINVWEHGDRLEVVE